uniref:HNH endonuclease 5 domain-containing protein n=1 Tax=Megaviridae environmental sample TaxID=1737588 RepID=A0A5J6VLR9_9VIRU|nr:MAG: hypothetical protein [Megaviridae environmental sample]
MPYGIHGKRRENDGSFVVFTSTIKHILQYIDDGTIKVPDFQREIDDRKVDGFVKECLRGLTRNQNIFIQSEFKLACNTVGTDCIIWLVDGQHRLKAARILCEQTDHIKDTDSIRLTIAKCDTYEDCYRYFKTMNISSDIEPIYKDLESSFNDRLILELKSYLKIHYKKGFSTQKNHSKYYHIDEFLSLFQYDNFKETEYIDHQNQLLLDKIKFKLKEFNQLIKEYISKNTDKYSLHTNSKLERTNIYFTLKYVNILELFKNKDTILVVKSELKPKQKKKNISKRLRLEVWNQNIGKNKRTGDCYECDASIKIEDFACGHIIAESKGGSTTIDNLAPVCTICNQSMQTENMNKFKDNYNAKMTTV